MQQSRRNPEITTTRKRKPTSESENTSATTADEKNNHNSNIIMRSTSASYASKKKTKKNNGGKKRRATPIRILVKCSWSGARLSPSSSDLMPSTTTTVEQIISNLSLQLPSIMTSPNTDGLQQQQQSQPSIVYMRKVVLKQDWAVTTIGHFLGDDVSCDSIMLTLNLPKDPMTMKATTSTTNFTPPVASASSSSAAAAAPPFSIVVQPGSNPGVTQQDSIMTSVPEAKTKVSNYNNNDNTSNTSNNDDDDEDMAEPMEIDDPEPAASPTTAVASLSPEPASTVASTATATKPPTIEEAIQNVLSSNFDSSSTEYFKTLLKILDNILSTPTPTLSGSNDDNASFTAATTTATTTSLSKNIKVRTLRLSNATVQKKIIEKKYGLDLLLHVIGFEYQLPSSSPSSLLQAPSLSNNNAPVGFDFDRSSSSNNTNNNFISQLPPPSTLTSETIVLLPKNENKTKIQSVRDAVAKVLVELLNVPMGEIPVAPSVQQHHHQQQHQTAANQTPSVPFDPFKAHSFNTQSAASGVPDPNSIIPGKRKEEKSTTERQLEILQKKQKDLEESMQSKLLDRNIIAILPGIVQGPIVTLPSSGDKDDSFTSTTTTRGDSTLIAIQMRRREEERKKREEGGFTTKTMRDLEKMKKQKVYSHAQLRVNFPDGSRLECKFLPNESIAVVKNVISSSFVPMSSSSSSDLRFDLYVSPPRRILADKNTLTQEGLVPAAKIHVSWKDGHSPPTGNRPGAYLQPHLFAAASMQLQQGIEMGGAGSSGNMSSFPDSKPLTETEDSNEKKMKASNISDNSGGSSAAGTKDTLASREEELMKRMMGKKKGGLGKGRTFGRGGRNSDKGSSNAGKGGNPKWFSSK